MIINSRQPIKHFAQNFCIDITAIRIVRDPNTILERERRVLESQGILLINQILQ